MDRSGAGSTGAGAGAGGGTYGLAGGDVLGLLLCMKLSMPIDCCENLRSELCRRSWLGPGEDSPRVSIAKGEVTGTCGREGMGYEACCSAGEGGTDTLPLAGPFVESFRLRPKNELLRETPCTGCTTSAFSSLGFDFESIKPSCQGPRDNPRVRRRSVLAETAGGPTVSDCAEWVGKADLWKLFARRTFDGPGALATPVVDSSEVDTGTNGCCCGITCGSPRPKAARANA